MEMIAAVFVERENSNVRLTCISAEFSWNYNNNKSIYSESKLERKTNFERKVNDTPSENVEKMNEWATEDARLKRRDVVEAGASGRSRFVPVNTQVVDQVNALAFYSFILLGFLWYSSLDVHCFAPRSHIDFPIPLNTSAVQDEHCDQGHVSVNPFSPFASSHYKYTHFRQQEGDDYERYWKLYISLISLCFLGSSVSIFYEK